MSRIYNTTPMLKAKIYKQIWFFCFAITILIIPVFSLDLLHEAVINRDYETVEGILERDIDNIELKANKASLNYVKNYRNFISYRSKSQVEQLIKNVFDKYDVINLNGWRPLNWAVFNDDPQMVELLLRYDADPNSLDSINATPLHWASLWSSIAVIKQLVNAGGEYWFRDDEGYTPLYRAIQREPAKQDSGIVNYFINQGAQIDRTDKKGRNAFLVAAAVNNIPVLNYLRRLDASLVESYDDEGNSPLHWAVAAKGNVNNAVVIKNLLGQGAFINSKNDVGRTPLHLAVYQRNGLAVRYLLDRSANPNIQDDLGDTPLHIAAKWGYKGMVQIFFDVFEKGSISRVLTAKAPRLNPNIRNQEGFNPLQVALYNAHPYTANEMLRFVNINPMEYDILGETSLHLAARNSNLQLMDNMIARTKNFGRKNFLLLENSRGQRVVEVAVEYNDTDMVIFLMKHGGLGQVRDFDVNRLFRFARSVKMERLLLKIKEDPKANLVSQ